MLSAGCGVSHGNVESPVDAEGHLPQVTLWLLAVAIVWHVDVGEDAVEMETCFLTCNKTANLLSIRLTVLSHLSMSKLDSYGKNSCVSLTIQGQDSVKKKLRECTYRCHHFILTTFPDGKLRQGEASCTPAGREGGGVTACIKQ